jgi:hypothetical protein
MIYPTLTTHNEKITFVKNYIQAVQQAEYGSNPTPLMIFGRGGEGKTKVVQEIRESSEIPILIFQEETPCLHMGTAPYTGRCAMILVNLGQPDDFKVADYFKATVVEFKPDPSMPSSSYA